MKARPSSSPMSWMVQMLGWFSAEAAWASRRKRAERLRVASYLIGKEFQRDKPVQPRVLGFVDHAHATAAQLGRGCGSAEIVVSIMA